jgi:hypothetical protein
MSLEYITFEGTVKFRHQTPENESDWPNQQFTPLVRSLAQLHGRHVQHAFFTREEAIHASLQGYDTERKETPCLVPRCGTNYPHGTTQARK